MSDFRCNICGEITPNRGVPFEREEASCSNCGSALRTRSLIRALVLELFGVEMGLPDLPRVMSIRGIGTSDSMQYAPRLAMKMDYRNTYLDREPALDLSNVPADEFGKYDFLISSEVLEHVSPPLVKSLDNAFRLLKPNGVLLMTVPYTPHTSAEHYPNLYRYGLAEIDGKTVLVNRTRGGTFEVHEDPQFHLSDDGIALEMRVFSESSLRKALTDAGFEEVKIYGDNYAPFGIVHKEMCSLPVAARKGRYSLSREAVRDVIDEWLSLRGAFQSKTGIPKKKTSRAWWQIGNGALSLKPGIAEQSAAELAAKSTFITADPSSIQYLRGFHEIEGSGWRWTERRFSVRLTPPPPRDGISREAMALVFAFAIPGETHEMLGTITLTGSTGDQTLKRVICDSPGPRTLRLDLPSEYVAADNVVIDFEIDKCIEAGKIDRRELGIIAGSIHLEVR